MLFQISAKMSIVFDGEWNEPASSSQRDIEAAERRNQFEVRFQVVLFFVKR